MREQLTTRVFLYITRVFLYIFISSTVHYTQNRRLTNITKRVEATVQDVGRGSEGGTSIGRGKRAERREAASAAKTVMYN